MVLDFLKSLEILSELGSDSIGDELSGSSVSWASLSVHEPGWNSMLGRSGKDVVDLNDFVLLDLSSSLVWVDPSSLKDDMGKSSADTLDGSKGETDLDSTLNVGVLDSQNMSEVIIFNCI